MIVPKSKTIPTYDPSRQAAKTSKLNVPKATTVPQSSFMDTVRANAANTTVKPVASVPKPPTQTYKSPELADWSSKQQELFSRLESQINTPFSYDPNKDAALQSQRALYEAGAAQASQNALETMNDRGIMGSSMTQSQLAQIQQNANTQFNALIPQYRDQAYNQHLNQISQAGQLLGEAYNLRNQQFNEGVTKAELTGTYLPDGAQPLVDNIYALKAQAESPNITAQQRAQLSSQADQLRARLTAMGVDVSGLGSDISLSNARVGQRTLQGQQLDFNQRTDQRDYDEGVRRYDQQFGYGQQRDQVADSQWNQQFQYGQQRDQVADDQWLQQFNEQVRQFGANNALDWANHSISQFNAQTGRMQQNRLASGDGSSSSKSSSTKIDSKDSYDLYYDIVNNFVDTNASAAERKEIAEIYREQLTESDYRKLKDWKPKE